MALLFWRDDVRHDAQTTPCSRSRRPSLCSGGVLLSLVAALIAGT